MSEDNLLLQSYPQYLAAFFTLDRRSKIAHRKDPKQSFPLPDLSAADAWDQNKNHSELHAARASACPEATKRPRRSDFYPMLPGQPRP
jgi:hypothetical protein